MPFFKYTVIGAFVRIGIGNHQGRAVYRVSITTHIQTIECKLTQDSVYCLCNSMHQNHVSVANIIFNYWLFTLKVCKIDNN